jgi:hypothetical protein
MVQPELHESNSVGESDGQFLVGMTVEDIGITVGLAFEKTAFPLDFLPLHLIFVKRLPPY